MGIGEVVPYAHIPNGDTVEVPNCKTCFCDCYLHPKRRKASISQAWWRVKKEMEGETPEYQPQFHLVHDLWTDTEELVSTLNE